jgi:hypothetical protein
MDDSSEDQDCSLKDILMAVKSQGDDNTKLRQENATFHNEIHPRENKLILIPSGQTNKLYYYFYLFRSCT